MAIVFTPEQAEHLLQELSKCNQNYESLRISSASSQFRSDKADEFYKHGFLRRLGLINRCINRVYEIQKPQSTSLLDKNELHDLIMSLQCHTLNVYGALDNLAWIWVYEKDLRKEDGTELDRKQVSLFSPLLRNSFPEEISKCIDKAKDWFNMVKNFRDALSHRIPFYVPPSELNPEEQKRYRSLEKERDDKIKAGNFEGAVNVFANCRKLGRSSRLMTHSFNEGAEKIIFHAQIIADWNTLLEIEGKMMKGKGSIFN